MLRNFMLVCVGLLLGYVITQVARAVSPGLAGTLSGGFPLTLNPTRLGVPSFHVTLGFHLVLNLANVIGVILAFYLAKNYRW